MNKTIDQLEKEKDECYTRPEKYKFERTDKLLAWGTAILDEAKQLVEENPI